MNEETQQKSDILTITPTDIIIKCNHCENISYICCLEDNEDEHSTVPISTALTRISWMANPESKCPSCEKKGSFSLLGVGNYKQESEFLKQQQELSDTNEVNDNEVNINAEVTEITEVTKADQLTNINNKLDKLIDILSNKVPYGGD